MAAFADQGSKSKARAHASGCHILEGLPTGPVSHSHSDMPSMGFRGATPRSKGEVQGEGRQPEGQSGRKVGARCHTQEDCKPYE